MSETITKEAPTGKNPAEDANKKNEHAPRYSKRAKMIASLAGLSIVAGGALGLSVANSGEKPPQATETSAPAVPTQEATPTAAPTANETEPGASTSEYIVPLEQLAGMSPEQLTAATTISVESVSVNGAIDWDLYAEKLYDAYTLQANAGVTKGEFEAVPMSVTEPGEFLSPKYDTPMTQGYSAEGVFEQNSAIISAHKTTLIASFIQYLSTGKMNVHGKFTAGKTKVYDVDPIGGTLLHLEGTYTDNLFSSGAVSADDIHSTSSLERSTDANFKMSDKALVRTIGDNLVIVGMSAD